MQTYTVDMRGHRDRRPAELLGADQTAPGGAFTSTDFDKAKKAFDNYLKTGTKNLKSDVGDYVRKNSARFMVAYRQIALQLGKPYAKADLAEWSAKLPAYGLEHGLVFLSAYRMAHEAGLIPESVYAPKSYLDAHPEQKKDPRSWYEQLADIVGKKLGKAAMWGGIGLAAYFILPKLLLTGVKAYGERKKATA